MVKFCTVEQVKRHTPIGANFTAYDDTIQDMIPAISDIVAQHCGRKFVYGQYTEYFGIPRMTQEGHWNVFLREPPVDMTVVGGFGVAVASGTLFSDDHEDLTNSYYRLDANSGKLTLENLYIPKALTRGGRVTYYGGYPVDSTDTQLVLVPAPVALATAIQVAFLLGRIANRRVGEKQTGPRGGRESEQAPKAYGGSLVNEAATLLIPHARPKVTFVG